MRNNYSIKSVLNLTCVFMFLVSLGILMSPTEADATSQWARKYEMSCNACHTVFPRLNNYGEDFKRNGYQVRTSQEEEEVEEFSIDELGDLLGIRLNMDAFKITTNAYVESSGSDATSKIEFARPNWLQMFAAGSIYKDISFFSELQFDIDHFHFSWFYFNFTNLFGSKLLNLNVGNLSPVDFSSYSNRLRQFPAVKGLVQRIKSSNGQGEKSIDISSSRPGIQYYGYGDWFVVYGGVTNGKFKTLSDQFDFWGGLRLLLPDNVIDGFEGSSVTMHYYGGTDTQLATDDVAGTFDRYKNDFSRLYPSINIKYNDVFDLQVGYVIGTESNWAMVETPTKDFGFSGISAQMSWLPNEQWHFGIAYDSYKSDAGIIEDGIVAFEKARIVPSVAYIFSEKYALWLYYEMDITDVPDDVKLQDVVYLNIRTMF